MSMVASLTFLFRLDRGAKEEFMRPLLENLLRRHRDGLEVYLDLVSTPQDSVRLFTEREKQFMSLQTLIRTGMVYCLIPLLNLAGAPIDFGGVG